MGTKIYALRDPSTEKARYVGKTVTSLKVRLANHEYKARSGRSITPVSHWILELLAANRHPQIVLLAEPLGRWQDSERQWIAKLRSDGADLLNLHPGGNGAHTRRELPTEFVQLLGVLSDGEVAVKAGLCRETITYHRRRMGISPAPRNIENVKLPFVSGHTPHNKVDLLGVEELLGTMSDLELSKRYGVTKGLIKQRRKAAGIPALQPTDRHPKGIEHCRGSQLSDDAVRQIRETYRPRLNVEQLAAQFGVSIHVIRDIVRGKTWRHVK